jgi:dimethylglycine dehydrogenase
MAIPLVGPVRGVQNYWVACGVMAGFLQGGGVGKSLAEWMVHGEPEADIFGMDIARYGDFMSNREYIRQTTGQFYSRRFVMSYPNEQLPAGRPLKMPPAYEGMTAAGARWGVSWGLEVPLYFAPDGLRGAQHAEALQCLRHRRRPNAVPCAKASASSISPPSRATRSADRMPKNGSTGSWPASSRSPAGPGSRRCWPQRPLKGDLTVFNWGDGRWWIMGSYYLRQWHMRWFEGLLEDGVNVSDISDDHDRLQPFRPECAQGA